MIFLIAIIILMSYTTTGYCKPYNNLLQNPGFETGSFTGWIVEGNAVCGVAKDNSIIQDAYFQPVYVISHSGDYAVFNLSANFRNIVTVLSQNVDVMPNTSYDIGFWILHGHPEQQVKIYPDILIDGKSAGTFTISAGCGYGINKNNYQLIKTKFVTSNTQKSIKVSFVLKASGLVFAGMSYDDFFVICSDPIINIAPTQGITGTIVTISGYNYLPDEHIAITINTECITNVITDKNGVFSAVFTIPQKSAEIVTITATGIISNKSAYSHFHLIKRGDFGDAPNSDIYIMNTGYFCEPDNFTAPEFMKYQAYFPIISHKIIDKEYLGRDVSKEVEIYDLQYDEDNTPNINPYTGTADMDSDDGLVLPVNLIPGATSTIQCIVTIDDTAISCTRYVNILFDWNQNGRWDDNNEWVVKNQPIDIPPGESKLIVSQEFMVDNNITGGCWMRITLTRIPVVVSNTWDGSGEFEYGETEDYFINIVPETDIWITQVLPENIELGQIITCKLRYGNQGNTLVDDVSLIMDIPYGLTYISEIYMIKDNQIIWDIDKLYPDSEEYMEIKLRVEPWINIKSGCTVTTSITCDMYDTDMDNNISVGIMRIKPPEGIGMISGRIIDKKDNKPLPSVLVKVIQDMPFKIAGMSFTSIDGEYVVDNLPDGKYIISTQVQGYMPQCIGDIVIDSNVRSINIDISMPKIEKGYRIAFCRFDNNGSYNVYIMNSDGTNIKQLTYNQQWDTAASISPDGSKIVFIRGDNIWNCGDMWVIDLENDNYEQLVLSGNISFPSFSYDSQQIVFCSNGNLCIINTDGSNYQKVLDMDEPILYPCFSPDNTQIVFVMNNDIYITSVDGSKVQKLTHGSEIDYAPSFAPDASMIIFTREHHISGNTDIWVMYRDGTNQMKIIDNGLFGRISPDDKQIVFVSTVEGNHDIYITDLEDRNSWQQLTSYTDVDTQPTWGCIARAPVVYVWPGDTDNNGIVNAQDIFPIAIYWGKSGYVRNMSVIWEPQAAVLWEIPEATYADANGDGIINAIDILPVGINWGMQHSVITKGTYAPILHCNDNINHKEYTEIYKMMYKILDDMDETYGIAQVKQILQHLIDEEDNMQKYAVVDTSLMQNYPNPFNPECWIPYTLKEEAHVIIRIYNISGQLVRILDEGIKPQGKYITKDEAVYWDGKNNEGNELASGVYIYQLQANGKIIGSKRMVMLK